MEGSPEKEIMAQIKYLNKSRQELSLIVVGYKEERANEDDFVAFISELTASVIKRHFSSYLSQDISMLDDFKQIAIEKCIKSVSYYNGSSNPINFFYTGIRNEIQNFIYHNYERSKKQDDIDDVHIIGADHSMDTDLSIRRLTDKVFKSHTISVNKGYKSFIACVHTFCHAPNFTMRDFKTPRDFMSFAIYSALYLKNDLFIRLFTLYRLFGDEIPIAFVVFFLSTLKAKFPNSNVMSRMLADMEILRVYYEHNTCIDDKRMERIKHRMNSFYEMDMDKTCGYVFLEIPFDMKVLGEEE